jgi:phage-related tail fiber protein
MKKAFCLLLIIFSMSCIAQKTFQKTIGGDKFERALFIDHTTDGGYILSGYSNSFNTNNSYDIYVIKTDAAANVQWQKTFGGNRTDIGWGVKELNDKTYLLFGAIGIDSTNDDIFVTRLDVEGNQLWQKTYGNEKYERCTQMLATSDGNFLLIGQRNAGPGNNIDSYVIKIDDKGNLLWEKTYGGVFPERTYYGGELPNGDFLISGSVLPYQTAKADIYLLRIDKNGNLVWSKTLGEENVHDIAHSFSKNKDGKTYTLTGYSGTVKEGAHEGLFIQIDEHGNLLKRQTHDTGDDLRLMHAEQTGDGGFIVAGYSRKDIAKNIHDAVLLKFNKEGKAEWVKTFGEAEKDDQGYWIVINNDGTYTFVGYTHSAGNNGDIWLIRTDTKGEI